MQAQGNMVMNQQGQPIGQLVFDEFGNPLILMAEQGDKKRLTGADAIRSNIIAARAVAETVSTSFGPKGMDKILVGSDGDVTITNDGATMLDLMHVDHHVAKLLVELSKSQDAEIGDGTTGVVIMAGALLTQALYLLDRGLHPLRIADGFEKACEVAVGEVTRIAREVDVLADNHAALRKAAATALGSKVVSGSQQQLAEIASQAVLAVADFARKDVNFDLIRVEGKVGGCIADTKLVPGVVLDKDFSHPQMPKSVTDAKVAILTCPFEPPKPKTKHKVEVKSVEDYRKLHETEQQYFVNQVERLQNAGCTLAICQWGFDDEANHLLYQRGLPAIRWVGGGELELVALTTGARIIPRFEEVTAEKLGFAKSVKELHLGTGKDTVLVIEGDSKSKAVTVLVRGGSQVVVEEGKRCIHDAICCVRNLIRNNRIVPGGGASEMAASIAVGKFANTFPSVEQYAIRAFAEALEAIPSALAGNSGLSVSETVPGLRLAQETTGNQWIGVDCIGTGESDMGKVGIHETLHSKSQQLKLATQVVRMILKIDDVIASGKYD